MSLLVDRQSKFFSDICRLRQFAEDLGYQVTAGEFERTQAQAELNAKNGVGIAGSNHCRRLAADLYFYRAGKLITGKVNLEAIGLFWESLGGRWGGRFKKYDDSNHFEAK